MGTPTPPGTAPTTTTRRHAAGITPSASPRPGSERSNANGVAAAGPEHGSRGKLDTPASQRRVEAGLQPDAVYAAVLAPWREAIRRAFVVPLATESEWIAAVQRKYRTPARDRFFFWSAVFGTHTFFTAFLPLLFFFGEGERARGLVLVVGLGIYISCVVKDIACTPRPYAPPVTRLTVSTHHREYGFPSSHSTNSISIALFFGGWLWQYRDDVGTGAVVAGWIFLAVYFVSIAGGRIYTGMHSMVDIAGGMLLGTLCWVSWLALHSTLNAWIESGSLTVPVVMVPLTLLGVHYHPETPDDCPCFEDAIAILAVILGVSMGHLLSVREPETFAPSPDLFLGPHGMLRAAPIVLMRIVLGIGAIFLWRLVMKATLLRALPPIFRIVSKVLDMPLPTRRFYLSAMTYKDAEMPIRKTLSFGDLRETVDDGVPGTPSPTLAAAPARRRSPSPLRLEKEALHTRIKSRAQAAEAEAGVMDAGRSNGHEAEAAAAAAKAKAKRKKQRKRAYPHYDAEVLTKVVVYTGIGIIAAAIMPATFPHVERAVGLY